jgi:hypothetical protein
MSKNKAKSRVRAYMLEHRAAAKEKLIDQEVEGMRSPNPGRDQILNRLWELATLSHEATRGTIAGQIKALVMIVAIEGLVPSGMNARRVSQPSAPPVEAGIPDWLRKQQHQPATEEPGDPVAAPKNQPAASQVPHPKPAAEPAPKSAIASSFANLDPKTTSSLNPFIKSQAQNPIPTADGLIFDAVLEPVNPISLSFSPNGLFSGRRR